MSLKRKSPLTAMALLVLALSSCEPDPTRILARGAIVPLKVGNEWGYRVKIFDETGAVTDSSYDTVRVVREIVIENELWFVDNGGNIQTNRSDGRWIHSDVSYLVEKFPCRINEMYRLVDTLTIVRVKNIDERVTVPSGMYLTYVYQWMRNGFPVGDFYYTPNLGMVKSEKYMQLGNGVYLIERKELVWVSVKE